MNKVYEKSFEPLGIENARILVLGTLPGRKSLKVNEYYSHSTNQFWKILREVFNSNYEFNSYDEKKKFIFDNKIVLWDVFKKAQRLDNSSDKNIKDGYINDFKKFLEKYEKIEIILFNGKEAEKIFNEYKKELEEIIDKRNIKCKYVCSSSGLNSIKIDKKIEEWKNAININKN